VKAMREILETGAFRKHLGAERTVT